MWQMYIVPVARIRGLVGPALGSDKVASICCDPIDLVRHRYK
jgi:hypothetical protein